MSATATAIAHMVRIGGECDLHGPHVESNCPECEYELVTDLESAQRQGRVVTITANGGQQ